MEITFCYKYSPNIPQPEMDVKLCDISFDINTCQGVNVQFNYTFWQYVEDEMLSKMDSLNPIAPCTGGIYPTTLLKISKPNCLEVVDDPIQQMSILKSCGTGSANCYTWYEVCKSEGELVKELGYGPIKVGDDFCPLPGEITPNLNTFGCFSSCY